ncbi:LysR family transcriptional regulator [Alkalibacterium iburiense]|uniref:LysR family transcriptional regulator n=1 Tax=Alkalibacterium iburiense TaxID=290589 RepID=A0ABP3GPZ9_9LACT
MDITSLRRFMVVASEGNISRAAKSLGLSQSTLSRQVMDLEEELGVTLFIRGNRQVTLTEEGTYLLSKAQEIISLSDKTQSDLRNLGSLVNGEIYIGIGETAGMSFVADKIIDLKKQFNHLSFHLYSGNELATMHKLENGLIDFGIVSQSMNVSTYQSISIPLKDEWGALFNRKHPLANEETVTREQLMGEPLIVPRQEEAMTPIYQWFGVSREKLNTAATYEQITHAALLTEKNIGVSIGLKDLVYTTNHPYLSFIPFDPPLTSPIKIVWKKAQNFSPAAQVFLDYLLETEAD